MIGKTLGHYKVGEQLGRGGMGEVYLADDLNLNRKVALKFLPDAFTGDPERMARFEREAKLLATLNHPNIAAIYGLEEAEGKRFLVLELVEGETLAQRLSKGPLPVEEALEICRQIADGLEAAHEKGVIHRDLKPGNVMITGEYRVKILDFGLAKVLAGETQGVDASQSPTLTDAMTQRGMILGTAAYMSPEQAKGKAVDKRADIWAFGCILYECLTGKRAFEAETITETLAAILKGEPNWEALPATIPSNIRFVLRRCLEKDVSRRFRDAADIRILIAEARDIGEARIAFEQPQENSPPTELSFQWRRRELLAWIGMVIFLIMATVLTVLHFHKNPATEVQNPIPMRFSVSAPSTDNWAGLSISPDGGNLAFFGANSKGSSSLWIHPLDSLVARELPGTEGNPWAYPFWSADSRFVTYVADGKLRKIDISWGSSQTICDAPVSATIPGGSWNPDGVILFPGTDGLYRVSAAGGVPARVTMLDATRQEITHMFPQFLPDGRHFIFLARSGRSENNAVYAGSLDSRDTLRLLAADSNTMYTLPGYLLFVRDGALLAQSFDQAKLQIQGEPVRVAEKLTAWEGTAAFSVSANGILAYRGDSTQKLRFQWRDRGGKPGAEMGKAGSYGDFDLSPDASQVMVAVLLGGFYLIDGNRNVTSALSDPAVLITDGDPIWSPDGRYIVFDRATRHQIIKISANGGSETILYQGDAGYAGPYSEDWSKDGRYLLGELISAYSTEIIAIQLVGDGKPISVAKGLISADEPHFSPDGRWVAFNSGESGRQEVYVVPFPPTGERWQVSTNGGVQARWRGNGQELFYLDPEGAMMASAIKPGPSFQNGVPQVLFQTGLRSAKYNMDQYAVTSDGNRFLVQLPETGTNQEAPITVVLNWTSLLKK
jgi:eukaryotic-like serine/threonine-protein kinase